ncbi:MAG: DUF1641 domain-containing protein [Pirellulaceae bacterium]|nr:DUF1641 domain-containing protein [Pirellulaceae bacterium]
MPIANPRETTTHDAELQATEAQDTKAQGAETQGAARLQQRLNDPRVAEGLSRLLDRIESVSFAVDAVEGFVSRGEVIIDSLTESANELRYAENSKWSNLAHQAPELIETGAKLAQASKAIDVDEVQRSKILERLSDPNTLAQINSLLDRLPLIAFLAESTEGFLRRGETIADNLAGMVGELKLNESSGVEQVGSLLEMLPKMQSLGEQVLGSELAGADLPKALDAGHAMLNSGIMDKQVIETLGRVGKMLADAYQSVSSQPVQPVGGFWAILRASKDPDVEKSLGFAFAFAKAFAKHLK